MTRRFPALLLAGTGSTTGALLHVVVVISGRSDWYQYFEAPPWVVQSVRDGTWIGPATGLIIAALMQAAGLFAFSAAGAIPRLPFLKSALVTLSVIGILRGLLIVPLVFYHPKHMPPLRTFDWVAAFIWALMGICFAIGARQTFKQKRRFGAYRGKFSVPPSFFEPLPEDELSGWE